MQLPKKAIITVAGTGTRFLPATKAVPKEMLPIINKPIVQYDVEEVVSAGVKEVILVIQENALATKNHFSDYNKILESMLKRGGKREMLKMIRDISRLAKFSYVSQKKSMGYGPAVPLMAAKNLIKNEPFLYLYGDDLTIAKVPFCRQLIDAYKKNPDVAGVIGVQRVPPKEVVRYGIVKLKKGTKNVLESTVEKPLIKDAPSDLAIFGRFLFTPKIIPIIENLKHGKNGELWLTDAIDQLARQAKVLVCEIKGQWLTTGDPLNYLKATVEFVWQRDDLRQEFKKYIVEKLKK
ncbi:UTP--glucose-1-phosphate uridylyltransferase [Candidatus Kuenenbacteria bacterium CG_4_9_14_3_um_filter_39_14]|uniref:UTP--glucose-1-phosphate uridylyltransferase n=4 Tax=Candidatus Kueneniibacteriota TaxID=1752740 RepID=A0A2M7ILZ6_9BACT|nr:UTP--glucose-1-phosphate uridylyltransferase [Candidatus Falkowbacteria bacterium]PIP75552.1 MAG: UTP--glucose-1-phosphate uridylyltransferase [Candidatus Kuenenbacteria bacterium CG22_combo_CG10-13_8_21_14_all_39_9]PIW95747.1 MAG: UTP--glucose-1-phosphate uridylyltransferase [Candidatus Kuenenbacteria bacterium CG_4_8_14_3_um_filter_39_15]PIX92676.1 MAG: UTP--glucose-1-phosphate uridylyltransferase [Candidatus Kuenenbacteria bacterium CG_4_10_14_3_um_filter_39_14]PJA91727.1 MAG: UTP--glucos